jgi:hypothetical protein
MLWLDDRSRMRRESHVRFCESLWGQFLGATRLNVSWGLSDCCRTLVPVFARRYLEKNTIMPRLLRKFLGLILLVTTIGLSTCQSMVEAAPVRAAHSAGLSAAAHSFERGIY